MPVRNKNTILCHHELVCVSFNRIPTCILNRSSYTLHTVLSQHGRLASRPRGSAYGPKRKRV